MKRFLIISFYYPPSLGIAGLRPASFARQLAKQGHHVTVFTRHWEGKENTWEDYLKSNLKPEKTATVEGAEVHFLPFKSTVRKAGGLASKYKTIFEHIVGDLNPELDCMQFAPAIDKHLQTNTYDYLLVSSPPLSLIKLGSQLAKKHQVKLIADFRDFENLDLVYHDFKQPIKKRLLLRLKSWNVKKWLKEAALTTVINQPIIWQFKKSGVTGKMIQVLNGFEKERFENLHQSAEAKTRFTIAVIGSIYPLQDVDTMIEGLNTFLKGKDPDKIKLQFVGIKAIDEVAEKLDREISWPSKELTVKISREKALQYGKDAQILFYPGWLGYKGIYSGKIFEYLGLQKNILIAPGDKDVLDDLVQDTQTGKIANSPMEMAQYLENWWKEWNEKGELTYHGDPGKINFYTREVQANLIISALGEEIKK